MARGKTTLRSRYNNDDEDDDGEGWWRLSVGDDALRSRTRVRGERGSSDQRRHKADRGGPPQPAGRRRAMVILTPPTDERAPPVQPPPLPSSPSSPPPPLIPGQVTNLDHNDWAKAVVESSGVSVVAVGFRNQYSPDLGRGSSVSCLRSSLAFLRVAFAYGIRSALSAEAIDRMLLQGIEWTAATTAAGKNFSMCYPHDLPDRILSQEAGGDLYAVLSSTYGEMPFYADDETAAVFLETQMSMRRFLDRVWIGRTGDTYCLLVIGAVGVGMYRSGDDVYLFDPHGHGEITQACVVRVTVGGLYKYLTSYADPAADIPWTGTFVYFVTTGPEPATREELRAAVSRLYGTADVVEWATENKHAAVVVSADYDPTVRPQPAVTRIVVGLAPVHAVDDGGGGGGDGGGGGGGAAVGSTDSGDRVDASDPGAEMVDDWNRDDEEEDEFYDADDSAPRPADEEDEMELPANVALPPSSGDEDSGANVWEVALAEPAPHPAYSIADRTADEELPSVPQTPPRGSRKRFGGKKRMRPVWTPPSSTENIAAERSARATRRKQTRSGGQRRSASSRTGLSGSSTELAVAIPDVTYAPHAPDAADFEEGALPRGSDAASAGPEPDYAAYLRNRPIFNPHHSISGSDGTAREGLWSDEYLAPSPLDGLFEKVRDVGEAIDAGLNTVVWVMRSSDGESDLLSLCMLDAFTRLFAYVIENGATTTPQRGSIVAPETAALLATFPIPTAFSAFIASTGMSLSEASLHSELIASVKEENAAIGGLALAKLVLVALEVDEITDALHGVLDSLEAELSAMDPSGSYEYMAAALVRELQKNPGGLYSETTSLHPSPSLTERVVNMCESVHAREEASRRSASLIAREIAAIDAGIRLMRSTFDTFFMGGTGEEMQTAPATVDVSAKAVTRRLAELAKAAQTAVGEGIGEYVVKVARYSAGVALSDDISSAKFRIDTNITQQGLSRMLSSLKTLDEELAHVASLADALQPHQVDRSMEASTLRDMITLGADLSTDENLVAWKALLVGAQAGGWVDRKTVDALLRDVDAINERAARRATAATELERFDALSAEVDRYAGGQDSADLAILDALVKSTEELLGAAKILLDTPRISSALDAHTKRRVASRRAEAETLLEASRNRSGLLKAALETTYASLRNILRPLQKFVGLRNLSATFRTISDSVPGDLGTLDSIIASAPSDIVGQLRTDLWTLVAQYKDVLEHPDATTGSALAGLGVSFALAIRVILGRHGEYPTASVFFGKHADAVAEAVSASVADPRSTAKAAKTVEVLRAAVRDVDKAAAVSAMRAEDTAEAAVAERGDAFLFLKHLLHHAEASLVSAREAEWREGAIKKLRDVAEDVARATGHVRSADPKTADDRQRAQLADEVAHTVRTASAAVEAVEREAGEIASGHDGRGRAPSPQERQQEGELVKVAAAVRQRIAEADAAYATYERQHTEARGVREREAWTRAVDGALARAETRSEFDVAELRGLANAASAGGYSTAQFKSRAERVLDIHLKTVRRAVETVLQFNPYTPENMRNKTMPPIALLRDITWGDAFMAAEANYSDLFGTDCEPLMSALRVSLMIIMHASAGSGAPDYYSLMGVLEKESRTFPQLAKYVEFYRKGHGEFTALVTRLDVLKADIVQAVGRIPSEISRALEEVTLVRSPELARQALERGVNLVVPSEAVIEAALGALRREDRNLYKGTAYEEYVTQAMRRDSDDAKVALDTARASRAEATERAKVILREVADAADAANKDAAENLANLKNLLRLAPIPAHVSKALEKANSPEDVVTQAALLLAKIEEADELDVQAVEMAAAARAIIDSHPLTALIDETGPMTPYTERIAALVDLRHKVDELKASLASAETAWDDAWINFTRERDRAGRSSEGYAAANQRAMQLLVTSNAITALRSDDAFRRLPAKTVGQIETKLAERGPALHSFLDSVKELDSFTKQLDAVLERVPEAFARGQLRHLAERYDILIKSVPKWYAAKTARYRQLIDLRLSLYAEYAGLKIAGISDADEPQLCPNDLVAAGGAGNAALPGTPDGLLKARIASWMGSKVMTTLQEASSDLDMGGRPTYLTASVKPLRYTMCYRTVCDKLGAVLCDPNSRSLRPPIPREPQTCAAMDAAAGILSDVLSMRLEYTHASGDRFERFSRFVRTKRSDWLPGENARALSETYTALIATTISRRTSGKWSDVYIFPGITGPTSDREEIRAALTATGRSGSGAKPVRFDPADIMVAIMAWVPNHLVSFSRLDLVRQHEFMDSTLISALNAALSNAVFINCLATPSGGGSAPPGARPLSLHGSEYDPSAGGLFAVRFSDWRQGRVSDLDPLKPWEEGGAEAAAGLAKIRAAVPSRMLTTITVLARMCIPPSALSAMWTAMRPDDADQDVKTYDDAITARLDLASTLDAASSSSSSSLSASAVLTDAGQASAFSGQDEPRPLYEPTGRTCTFTVVSAPSSDLSTVSAMDIAAAATLFGARVVVAAECVGAFSVESGLTLCIRLFDSRAGSRGCYLEPSAVSTDLMSWGYKLLSADVNHVENACLSQQLEYLSSLVASKPLASAPPCLIVTDDKMRPKRVLWAKPIHEPLPAVRLISESDEVIAELPYVEVDDVGGATDAIARDYMNMTDINTIADFFADERRRYPTPRYQGDVTDDRSEETSYPSLPSSYDTELESEGFGDDDSFVLTGIDDYMPIDDESIWGRFLTDEERSRAPYRTPRPVPPPELPPLPPSPIDVKPPTIDTDTDADGGDGDTDGDGDGGDSDGGELPGWDVEESESELPVEERRDELQPDVEPSGAPVELPDIPELEDERSPRSSQSTPPPLHLELLELLQEESEDELTPEPSPHPLVIDLQALEPQPDPVWPGAGEPAVGPSIKPKPRPRPPPKNRRTIPASYSNVRTASALDGLEDPAESAPRVPIIVPTIIIDDGSGSSSSAREEWPRSREDEMAAEVEVPIITDGGTGEDWGVWDAGGKQPAPGATAYPLPRPFRERKIWPGKRPDDAGPRKPAGGMRSWTPSANIRTALSKYGGDERAFPPPTIIEAGEGELGDAGGAASVPVRDAALEPAPTSRPEYAGPVIIPVASADSDEETGLTASRIWKPTPRPFPPVPRPPVQPDESARRPVARTTVINKPASRVQMRVNVTAEADKGNRAQHIPLPPSEGESEYSTDDEPLTASEDDYEEEEQQEPCSSGEEAEGDGRHKPSSKYPKGRVIASDDLLTRRDFRKASRGALYSLMRACALIAGRIAQVRKELGSKTMDLTVDILKIKMILLG
ncbi:large tegument protein [Columbid alphaherpesvirus 1]|uniref:Large tegument protein n=1 Tax=Columbid alphaherpesvirus 1 TaxID=93386 RepID=A0A1V0M8I8_9ALPH|nr:large tegument protein [Columbid alphaherpesvirus 1]ARD71361.1 large tegument protein [Columbid alphaherpesvirus 1]